MECSFEAKCVLELEHKPGWERSKHVGTKFNLKVSENLVKEQYIDKDDLPTKEGTKVLSNVFVQGLVGNIHQGHKNGFWNDVEHLRYIIAELEKGFAAVTNVGTSTF